MTISVCRSVNSTLTITTKLAGGAVNRILPTSFRNNDTRVSAEAYKQQKSKAKRRNLKPGDVVLLAVAFREGNGLLLE